MNMYASRRHSQELRGVEGSGWAARRAEKAPSEPHVRAKYAMTPERSAQGRNRTADTGTFNSSVGNSAAACERICTAASRS
jgi:hypothetical protein